jgi:hypothetical protein
MSYIFSKKLREKNPNRANPNKIIGKIKPIVKVN